MLLYSVWKSGGVDQVTYFATKELDYSSDGDVSKKLQKFEVMGLVRSRGTGYELTSKGMARIRTLVWPRYLAYMFLLVSAGVLVWGLYGVLTGLSFAPLLVLVSGVTFASLSVLTLYLQFEAEKELAQYWRKRPQ